MVHITVLQEFQRLEQEDQEFKLAPGYTETLFNKERGRRGREEGRERKRRRLKSVPQNTLGLPLPCAPHPHDPQSPVTVPFFTVLTK